MKKLITLIAILLFSLNSFSQTDIDTTSIRLYKPIARLVIKDLINGDSANQQITLLSQQITLLQNKVRLQDSVISNYRLKYDNLSSILEIKDKQIDLAMDLTRQAEKQLKVQKLKNKLTFGGGILAIVGVILITN